MTDENKEKATIAIANSIMGQITLSDVLQLVQGNVLTQARDHVNNLEEEKLEKLIATLDAGDDPAVQRVESPEEKLEAVGNEG